MDAMCAAAGPWVRMAVDGLIVTVRPSPERARIAEESSASVSA
jgi:hypothetical protein